MLAKNNIQKIFLNILAVQVVLNITSNFCNIANGYIAGNFLDNIAVSCNSLINPLNMAINAIAHIFSSSSEILCGKYLGIGDKKSLNKTFSTTIIIAVTVGVLLTILVFAFPSKIVTLLGANLQLLNPAKSYLYGYSLGILASILMPIFISFLNIENEGKHVTKSVILLTVTYIIFGYTFTSLLNLSYFGLGLTNSLSKICALLFLLFKLVQNRKQIHFEFIKLDKHFIQRIILVGLPSGYSGVLLSIRNLIFNKVLISTGGVVAAAAYSVTVSGVTLQDSLITACLNATRIVTSICVGERNKQDLKLLIKFFFTVIMPINIVLIVIQILSSGITASVFSNDINTINLATITIKLYLIAAILELLNCFIIAIYTVFEKYKFINFFNIMHNCLLHITFILLTKNYLHYYSVFMGYIFTEFISFIILVVYSYIKNKHIVKTYYDLVVIDDDFETSTKLYISIDSYNQITNISENITSFCLENNINLRNSNLTGLCVEEMLTNIFEHGFTKKKVNNKRIDIFLIIENDTITIRIRDNSITFDIESRSAIFNPKDPCKNIGLRIIKNISKEITYQNLFGLNNTIIKI